MLLSYRKRFKQPIIQTEEILDDTLDSLREEIFLGNSCSQTIVDLEKNIIYTLEENVHNLNEIFFDMKEGNKTIIDIFRGKTFQLISTNHMHELKENTYGDISFN